MSSEFSLIDRIRARIALRPDVVLGIGDDAAIVQVPPGHELVIATDILNVGVHFPAETAPADIGWKALAVNLSDLAAMGAMPAWCTLSLSLPDGDPDWLDAFFDGFLDLALPADITLVGGDTTRGPLSVGVTACGLVPAGSALRRDGARVGDDVWVSGTLGDAALGLRDVLQGRATDPGLRARLDRPEPRLALGHALRGVANACIDVSDGVLQDLGHVCAASGVGASLDLDALPAGAGVAAIQDPDERAALQSSGDDYELCFTSDPARRERILAEARAVRTPVTRVGTINAGAGVQCLRDGVPVDLPQRGFDHFGHLN